ncbi:MAG: prepilin-type N-terminal cleavage/methylation domain-containing protein [Lutisporaceae bacterium]
MLKHLKNKKGVTLIEILITLTILGIVIIPLSGLLINSVKINTDSRIFMEANYIAQTFIENWKAKNLSSLMDETQIQSLNDGNVITLTEAYQGYIVETMITPIVQYSTVDTNSYTVDALIKINETDDKLSIYNESGIMLSEQNLMPTYDIYIEKPVSTNQISISGITISALSTESAILQILCVNQADVIFNIYNRTDKDAIIYVIKTKQAENANISILAQVGNVKSESSIVQPYNNNLYEIQITVKKNEKALTTLKGSKLIEFK